MTFLPSNSLAAGFYIIISTLFFFLEQCQNNCPTIAQVILVVLFWIQHINILLIPALFSHKDLKINTCELEITSINSCELCGMIYQGL